MFFDFDWGVAMRFKFIFLFVFIFLSPVIAFARGIDEVERRLLVSISDEISVCMIRYAGNHITSGERAGDVVDAAISACSGEIERMREFSRKVFVDPAAGEVLQREQRIIADDFVEGGIKGQRAALIKSILDFRSDFSGKK